MIDLPDTSIWVQYLCHGRSRPIGLALDKLLDDRAVVVCGPVLAEALPTLLRYAPDKADRGGL